VDPAPAICESHKSMESDSGNDAKRPGLREQRYTIRYPFAADAEMLELESGTRVSGVTSDLSAGGCFVCACHPLDVGARIRGTLTHNGQKVEMLAVVRVVKERFGMGLEFLDLDPNSHATLLAWMRTLQQSRLIEDE
jgi:c-di-GMP-binding flagellar brake protein YcgR